MGCGAPPAREFDGLIVWEEESSECERSRGASGTCTCELTQYVTGRHSQTNCLYFSAVIIISQPFSAVSQPSFRPTFQRQSVDCVSIEASPLKGQIA